MAKCRRCGALFDYDREEGVCPRCCFYNRPAGSPHHGDEWLSSYNIDDNTYEPPKQSMTFEEEADSIWTKRLRRGRKKYSFDKDCHTEGSHVHVDSASKRITGNAGEPKGITPSKFSAGRILVCALLLAVILFGVKNLYHKLPSLPSDTDKAPEKPAPQEFAVEEMAWDALQKGAAIGDMTFTTDAQGAVVLFEEGQIPELQPGEICVGVPLKTDESRLGYSGIAWKRPYVYDGRYYRELVDKSLMGAKGINVRMGIDFMSEFLSVYNEKDFDGMAAYFIDKDAEEITLCIPIQTIEDDKVVTSGVTQIKLPVRRIRQEGGDSNG